MARIIGTKEATMFLTRYPLEANKSIKKALRAAGRPIAAAVRHATPFSQWKKLVRVKVKNAKKSGRIYMTAGYHDDMKSEGGRIRMWHRVYFRNYGTVDRRDPSHEFRYGKGEFAGNNPVGQFHRNFYDKAVAGLEDPVSMKFRSTIELEHERLLRKIK